MLLFMGDRNDLLQLLNKMINVFFLLAFLGLTCGEGVKKHLGKDRQPSHVASQA